MVNIVVVSHSAQLAAGVRELAQQMVQEKVQIALAAGVDDPEQPIGTDALKVLEAIRSVYSADGVLVLMDLGSAVLSAETALEFLEPDERENVRLCPAPLVEGALAAAVQASVGADLEAVFSEAMGALGSKQQQMPEPAETPAKREQRPGAAADVIRLTVPNRLGLHARPAARFVSTASQFEADIQVSKGDRQANAKSMNQVATLGARQGDEIVITASGPDARQALDALETLAQDNFGDEVDGQPPAPPVAAEKPEPSPRLPASGENTLTGIGASPGIAIGPLLHYRPALPEVQLTPAGDPEEEWQQLQRAVDEALAEIEALREQVVKLGNPDEAEIFMAHELILRDPSLLQEVQEQILGQSVGAPGAWQAQIDALAAEYRAIEDEYMRARADDVVDVGRRVLGHLLELEPTTLTMDAPSVVAARELAPSDTARFDPQAVLALCTELGGATSHSAILARALGIPAVVGIGPALRAVPNGQRVALDGESGTVWLQPDEETVAELRERRERFLRRQEQARRSAQREAVTLDGQRIEVAANIAGPQDLDRALDLGAEGVGLFRTEFLFLGRSAAPSEEEQFDVYRQVAARLGQKPLIIRTLDVGGDKPLPYLDLGAEENPFLGWRGIRFCLDNPDVFMPQLRAILRASHEHNVKLMFPMVSTVAEVQNARALLSQARQQLLEEDENFDEDMEVGIMIEVPAAVAIADQLAREVDFFSIGTNDLTQYVMAADRGNARVSGLADALQPAVLRQVAQTVAAAHAAGIWVGMCGELAGNVLATPLLVGLGLDELSMNAPSIPRVKERIRNADRSRLQQTAREILQLAHVSAVEEVLRALPEEAGEA